MLNDRQREALFLEVHREIEVAAVTAAETILGLRPVPDLAYPPNGGLSQAERASLSNGQPNAEAIAALRKVIADAAAAPIFTFLSLLDAVSDPPGFDGPWLPFHIAQATEEQYEPLMLHDALFDTYSLWRDRRPDPGWSLDNLQGQPPGGGSSGASDAG